MTKILAVSDAVDPSLYDRFDPARWSDVDLIISCGDLPPTYLDFLCTSFNCPVLYVRGNHDKEYERDAYSGCFNLHRRTWSGLGLNVIGFEGSRWYNGKNLQYSEREMQWMVRRSTRRLAKIDIVVSHAPPMGCQDRADPCHEGFACYRDLIGAKHPRYFIHGHSHLYGTELRTEHIAGTTTVNAFGRALITL